MTTGKTLITSAALMAAAACAAADSPVIVATDAYRWAGDTIYQDEFKAWAESPYEIRSTYKGRPGYFMPVEQTWRRKNYLSAYPKLSTPNMLHQAIYNMGLDEMVNAVEPDTTLRTGKEWAGVWTRDVSYSIILSMAYMQPEAAMVSLMKKVNSSGQIVQDTGSGGAWPISTDRMVWVLAAYEVYKVTGSRAWLEEVYPIAVRSLAKDKATVLTADGLVKGETSFIDWREQSYPRWMQTADISQSVAMGTNVMYCAAIKAVAEMARLLGHTKEAQEYASEAAGMAEMIDRTFWLADKGYYGMYTYGRDNKIVNPRAETLGEALAILYDIAPADHQKSIAENNPHTPYGPGIFYPQIPDMPNYHNNALWPFVASYWALAQAKAGNEQGTLEGIGSVFRPAALFATNKENFNLDNGDYYTELNSSNMLWSLSGNIALTTRILFGIHFENDGLLIKPFVPKALEGTRSLRDFRYRNAIINLTVEGYGANVKSISLNGNPITPGEVIPADKLNGVCYITVTMDNRPIAPMKVNNVANRKAPLTPATWIADGRLQWNPIEYIAGYEVLKDGKVVAVTRQTDYPIDGPAEWQVVGFDGDGVRGFASEPRSTRERMTAEFATETTKMHSPEVSYQPSTPVTGYNGGFAEIDRSTDSPEAIVEIPENGTYTISVRYANGNGPVNTENKAAIRSLMIDGKKRGTVVMPQRGVANWDDWGMSNLTRVDLKKGRHTIRLVYTPADENMNIATNHALLDRVVLEKVAQ